MSVCLQKQHLQVFQKTEKRHWCNFKQDKKCFIKIILKLSCGRRKIERQGGNSTYFNVVFVACGASVLTSFCKSPQSRFVWVEYPENYFDLVSYVKRSFHKNFNPSRHPQEHSLQTDMHFIFLYQLLKSCLYIFIFPPKQPFKCSLKKVMFFKKMLFKKFHTSNYIAANFPASY